MPVHSNRKSRRRSGAVSDMAAADTAEVQRSIFPLVIPIGGRTGG